MVFYQVLKNQVGRDRYMFSLNYLLSKLINAQEKNQLTVDIKKQSKIILKVLDLLTKEGFIVGYVIQKKILIIFLKYYNKNPLLTKFYFISKPSLRVYFTKKKLKNFFTKKGKNLLLIISTPKGIMNGEEAISKKIGGEPLFYLKN